MDGNMKFNFPKISLNHSSIIHSTNYLHHGCSPKHKRIRQEYLFICLQTSSGKFKHSPFRRIFYVHLLQNEITWKRLTSSSPKDGPPFHPFHKSNFFHLTEKVMASVFRDAKRILLIDYLSKNQYCEYYAAHEVYRRKNSVLPQPCVQLGTICFVR